MRGLIPDFVTGNASTCVVSVNSSDGCGFQRIRAWCTPHGTRRCVGFGDSVAIGDSGSAPRECLTRLGWLVSASGIFWATTEQIGRYKEWYLQMAKTWNFCFAGSCIGATFSRWRSFESERAKLVRDCFSISPWPFLMVTPLPGCLFVCFWSGLLAVFLCWTLGVTVYVFLPISFWTWPQLPQSTHKVIQDAKNNLMGHWCWVP